MKGTNDMPDAGAFVAINIKFHKKKVLEYGRADNRPSPNKQNY